MITLSSKGDWKETKKYLEKISRNKLDNILHEIAEEGLDALKKATPTDTGLLKSSWGYTIENNSSCTNITWTNNDVEKGYNIAIIVDSGHGTGTGGFVYGRHFIEPALQPIFDGFLDRIWREVNR